ncbi:MAG TPA: hypothetical protein VK070_07060 [Acidimicrobiia bacterium]|nr:hypothetical protein [Acidimicrobiia bacterium]
MPTPMRDTGGAGGASERRATSGRGRGTRPNARRSREESRRRDVLDTVINEMSGVVGDHLRRRLAAGDTADMLNVIRNMSSRIGGMLPQAPVPPIPSGGFFGGASPMLQAAGAGAAGPMPPLPPDMGMPGGGTFPPGIGSAIAGLGAGAGVPPLPPDMGIPGGGFAPGMQPPMSGGYFSPYSPMGRLIANGATPQNIDMLLQMLMNRPAMPAPRRDERQ